MYIGKLSIVTVFGMAMGWLEAVTVVYIRKILYAEKVINLTKVIIEQIDLNIMRIEQTREVATIIMLFTFSLLIEKNWYRRLAIFLWVFAIWDIFYYIALKMLINWPISLTTVDCLFLIPVPWIAPVYLPVLISIIMLITSGLLLFKDKYKFEKLNSQK